MRTIEVVEYGIVQSLALDQSQRDGLLNCGGNLELSPEPGTEGLWRLRAGSHVGTIVVSGLNIRIRPKLSIARLFVMLSAASGSIRWGERDADLAAGFTVEDVVAAALTHSILRGLAKGLLRGYVIAEEENCVVRGRLDVAETLKRRSATLLPLVQTPEFLDENIQENRILATALVLLLQRVTSPSVRSRVLDCQRAFAGVSFLARGAPLPKIHRNRLNGDWWGSIELAQLVLRSAGLDLPKGVHSVRSFLVDMNVVFEQFVFRALADELGRTGHALQKKRGGLYLDEDERHALVPDLSLWSGSRCVFAGDAKYKFVADGIARREDIYQCLAYSAATGLRQITLFYGGGSRLAHDESIVDGKTKVLVRVLDLSAPQDQLRDQFGSLAKSVVRSL